METLSALKEWAVCWNTFTTGMPRTYSVVAWLMSSRASWYTLMNCILSGPIMEKMHANDMITASRQARPMRQS